MRTGGIAAHATRTCGTRKSANWSAPSRGGFEAYSAPCAQGLIAACSAGPALNRPLLMQLMSLVVVLTLKSFFTLLTPLYLLPPKSQAARRRAQLYKTSFSLRRAAPCRHRLPLFAPAVLSAPVVPSFTRKGTLNSAGADSALEWPCAYD